MTTFDLDEVQAFAASLDARIGKCQNGEGMECASLDAALHYHAHLCCEFVCKAKQWGYGIFAGRVKYDSAVESLWLSEGNRLYQRALEYHRRGQTAILPCYDLPGQDVLVSALWDLERLLKGWVTPALSVGAAARQGAVMDVGGCHEGSPAARGAAVSSGRMAAG